jgi:hypothetical protein
MANLAATVAIEHAGGIVQRAAIATDRLSC